MPGFQFGDPLAGVLPCRLLVLRLATEAIPLAAYVRLSVPVRALALAAMDMDSHDRYPPSRLRSQRLWRSVWRAVGGGGGGGAPPPVPFLALATPARRPHRRVPG